MNIKISVPFFKVIVLSVGLFESVIIDERHFSDRNGADAYIKSLNDGLVGVLVEV